MNKREEIDSAGVVYLVAIIFVIKIVDNLIKSGEWLNCVIILIIGVVSYYAIKFIKHEKKERPAKLPKEYRNKYLIFPQYIPPKDLNPAEAGLLYNCKVDVSDLTSLIYQWAFEKLIYIRNIKGVRDGKSLSQIELDKLKDIDESRPFFEKEIFNSIFAVNNKKLITNSFELRYALILEDLEYHGLKKGWISKSNGGDFLGLIYKLLIILLFVLGYIYIIGGFFTHPALWIIILVMLLVCVLLGGYIDGGKMKLTDKGAKLAAYVIGYRNFIKSCDEDMIKFYLKEDPLFIDKTLPYATAFGLETEFLNKVTPLAEDWKAQYVNGQKVTPLMKVIATLLRSSNRGKFDIFYHW